MSVCIPNNILLNIYDITLKECIPNLTIFSISFLESLEKTNKQIDKHSNKQIDKHSNKQTIVIQALSKYKIKTNEKFYRKGIIENTFFIKLNHLKFNSLNLSESNNYEKERTYTNFKKFSTKLCDYNWLLSFNIFLYYTNELNSRLDFVKTKDIRLLNIGNGRCGFISGLYYYFYMSNKSNNDNTLNQYYLKWIGFDINNNISNSHFVKLSKLLDLLNPDSYKIIHGIINDDITDCKNLMYIKTLIENEFNDVNILYNNIKPRMEKSKSSGIMLSIIILSLYSLNSGGLMITKILEPEFWDNNFINYLTVLALLFKQTKIFRFPVCKNHITYYRYYLFGYCKKIISYNNIVGMRLIYILNTIKNHIYTQELNKDSNPLLLNEINKNEEIIVWKQKLLDIKASYINVISNPISELQLNIEQLQLLI